MELLLKLADVIDENAEELARLESSTSASRGGSPSTSRPSCRTTSASSRARRATSRARPRRVRRGLHVDDPARAARRRAGIAPWNYPLFMVMWKLGPALAAGNVQIVKPAEQTPLTVLRFVELAQEFLPAGVLQVVTGEGVPTGDRLVGIPRFRSSRSRATPRPGSSSRRTRPDTVKRVHLELGGKAPMVVLDDADPRRSPRRSRSAATFNSGQDCTASSRILVSERIYDDVLSRPSPPWRA
jgi:acyl-CoA reductase-like NAD-dependent aldehyde dehydrogenase